MFLKELKEWESLDAESQDSRHLLDIMQTLGWLHFSDSRHLL
jgi:hypothetical protein